MIEFKKRTSGNYVGKSATGSTITIFRKQDDYGTLEDNEWEWVISPNNGTRDNPQWGIDTFPTPEEALEDLARYVKINYNHDLEWSMV